MCIYGNCRTTLIVFFNIIVGSETVITGNDFSPWSVEKVWAVLTEAPEKGKEDNRLSNFPD